MEYGLVYSRVQNGLKFVGNMLYPKPTPDCLDNLVPHGQYEHNEEEIDHQQLLFTNMKLFFLLFLFLIFISFLVFLCEIYEII